MWDTYVQVGGVACPLTRPGTRRFLVAADYALGLQFEADAAAIVGAAGGQVVGSVRHPLPSNHPAKATGEPLRQRRCREQACASSRAAARVVGRRGDR
jgi:hypothetical protein